MPSVFPKMVLRALHGKRHAKKMNKCGKLHLPPIQTVCDWLHPSAFPGSRTNNNQISTRKKTKQKKGINHVKIVAADFYSHFIPLGRQPKHQDCLYSHWCDHVCPFWEFSSTNCSFLWFPFPFLFHNTILLTIHRRFIFFEPKGAGKNAVMFFHRQGWLSQTDINKCQRQRYLNVSLVFSGWNTLPVRFCGGNTSKDPHIQSAWLKEELPEAVWRPDEVPQRK